MKTIKVFLYFPPDRTDKPISYHLIKDFDLVLNILQGQITPGKRGRLTVELTGDEENIERGLRFLDEQGVRYRIFAKSILWNEGKCVHCGACTAVRPSRALYMDPVTWSLTFEQEKCLICEACIKACPLDAMDVDTFL